MDKKEETRLSKFLSLILRHQPETIGISLDEAGWADVDQLILKAREHGVDLNKSILDFIVSNNAKKRFSYNTDSSKIRASQGHSVKVSLGYEAKEPPLKLYHGTGIHSVESILKTGLESRKRQHVHLSNDIDTALKVGQRHGKPFIFEISAREMSLEGHDFFLSQNNVWLTDSVPPHFIKPLE